MGNAAILAPPSPPPGGALPVPRALVWRVFLLRDRGKKMALDQILRTEITGILTTSDSDDFPPLANVTHVSGYPPLGNLWQIRIKVLPTGLLIRGSDTVTMAPGEFQRVPQAWWCILT